MAATRRAPLRAVALLLLALGTASASRELNQLGLGKGKGAVAPVQPLAIVNNAAYVQPAMLVQNEPAYVRPAVLPTDVMKAKLADMKNKAVSMLAAKKAAPAAAVAPVYVQQAPVAMAPIYASGVALPVTQPYLFVPKYKWYDFPFIKKVLTLGITADKTPDPPYVPPTVVPDPKKAAFAGFVSNAAAAVTGGFAPQPAYTQPAYAQPGPQPAAMQQYAQQAGLQQYPQQAAQQQYAQQAPMRESGAVAAVPFGLSAAAPSQMQMAAPAPTPMVVISQQPQSQMLMQPGAAYIQAQQGQRESGAATAQVYGQPMPGSQAAGAYVAQHANAAPAQPISMLPMQSQFAAGSLTPAMG